jgi:hypothetical protein
MMKWSLGQHFVVAIFGTFGRYVRGTFVENVKKSPKIQPTLLYSSKCDDTTELFAKVPWPNLPNQ